LHKTDPTFIQKVITKANDLPAFWRERYKQTLAENSALKFKITHLEKRILTETVEKKVVQGRSKFKLDNAVLSDEEDGMLTVNDFATVPATNSLLVNSGGINVVATFRGRGP
jgi:hypothetical protein